MKCLKKHVMANSFSDYSTDNDGTNSFDFYLNLTIATFWGIISVWVHAYLPELDLMDLKFLKILE